MTLTREPKHFFAIWKEASWRRHLEGGIWEASGKLSEALWELSEELSGFWGGHGGFKGILDRKCSKFNMLHSKSEKSTISLRFFEGSVTIVFVLQHFSADAEPGRPCRRPPWSPRDAARNLTVKAVFG